MGTGTDGSGSGTVLRSKHFAKFGASERRKGGSEGLIREIDAAGRLGVGLSTLRLWRRRGQGPRFAKLGRVVRYRLADVERFVQEQLVDGAARHEGN